MPPPRKLPKDPAAARAMGLGQIDEMFPMTERRGRPSKASRRAQPRSAGPYGASTAAHATAASSVRQTRTNWSLPKHAELLRKAQDEWDDKKSRCTEDTTMQQFAAVVGIPHGTLQK